jgi:hypothetical protein
MPREVGFATGRLSVPVLVAACWLACRSGNQPAHESTPAPLSNHVAASTGGASYGGISYGSVYDDYGEVIGKVSGSGWVPVARDAEAGTGSDSPPPILGRPTVSAGMDKMELRRYVKRHLAEIVACYEKELADHPKLAGTVTAQFQITHGGVVRSASATGLTGVDVCIVAVIKSIEFQKRYWPDFVDVTYPFEFHPGVVNK